MITKNKLIFIVLLIFGAWIRSLDVWRPVDGRVREAWRECDYAAVARNFYREDMNILYPRIDWRGNGPGFAETEFPIIPWTIAALYKIFGYHEIIGMVLVYVISLLTLLIFFSLARHLLPHWAAIATSLFFIFNPLAVRVSNTLQPEGLMLFFYIAATYSFIRWIENNRWGWYLTALIVTALCLLVKIPSAHIGIFFLLLLLKEKGFKGLRAARVWIYGVLVLLPSLLWYIHAHRLWLGYGNSLGVSNEYHWFGWDLLKDPSLFARFVLRLARTEVLYVWTPLAGIATLAVIWFKRKDRVVRICLYWLLAIVIYFLITIRTTADNWATYYHVIAVPAAALLFGVGVVFLWDRIQKEGIRLFYLLSSTALALVVILGGVFFGLTYGRYFFLAAVLLVYSLSAAVLPWIAGKKDKMPLSGPKEIAPRISILMFILGFCLFSALSFHARQICRDLHPQQMQSKYACAMSFKPLIPEKALILASGGPSKDETGRPVAFNASYMFFWLDRKGFNIPIDQQSLENVIEFIRKGATYYVLEKSAEASALRFEDEMIKNFTLIAECNEAYLLKF